MIQLLVIADDFTGALDTGIQFCSAKTKLKIINTADDITISADELDLSVLIVDTETRHLKSEEAYKIVHALVSNAKAAGVRYIYKKTDSALRGNIGSELEAIVNATGENMHFIPAYPMADRITVNGVQYVGGRPVSESVFGKDPFEPVTRSRVDEIIALQSSMPVSFDYEKPESKGTIVYNADSVEAIEEIASNLNRRGQLSIVAGCAGFAQVMRQYIQLEARDSMTLDMPGRMLTVCGSINPITTAQLDWAEKHGTYKINLSSRQKEDPSWMDTTEGRQLIREYTAKANHQNAIITSDYDPDQTPKDMCLIQKLREKIAANYGLLIKNMLDEGLDTTILLTGGDILAAFLKCISIKSLVPVVQLIDGIVLSELYYQGKKIYIISKSGGLGNKSAITDLENMLKCQEENKCKQATI